MYSSVQCKRVVLETRNHISLYDIQDDDTHLDCISPLKQKLDKPFFMELIILCYWAMGMTRNRNIFKRIQPNLNSCKSSFKSELKWLKSSVTRNMGFLQHGWAILFDHLVSSFSSFSYVRSLVQLKMSIYLYSRVLPFSLKKLLPH
jgi:hypothetical protein